MSIVTPPSTHLQHAQAVLEAGKHVLAEKPFAMNAEEARRMRAAHEAACAKYNRRLIAIIDHELRFHSSTRDVKAFILSGSFGRVTKAHHRFYGVMPSIAQKEWSWWSDSSQFGGVLGAVGSHFIDLLSFLTSTEVTSVQCRCETIVREKLDGVTMKQVTSDDSAEFSTKHRSNPASPRQSYRGSAEHPQEFVATTTLVAASFGYSQNELLILSTRGALTCSLSTMTFTYTPASLEQPRVDETTKVTVWESDAPKERVQPALPLSPFVQGTVLVGQRLVKAVEECEAELKSGSSSSSNLTDLPPSLAGFAATFSDGVYVQTVLDRARDSSAEGGVWKECTYDD